MTTISPAIIDRLKRATDLADLVSEYITLQKRGSQWWGLCPFHKDSRATNFTVHPGGYYKCHACDAKGDAFTFLQAIDGLSFSRAAESLSDRTGISLEGRKVSRVLAAFEREQRAICDWWFKRMRRQILTAERDAINRERLVCEALNRLAHDEYWDDHHDAPAYLVAMGRMDLQIEFEVTLDAHDPTEMIAAAEFADCCARILVRMDDMLYPERLDLFIRLSNAVDHREYKRAIKADSDLLAWWCGLPWNVTPSPSGTSACNYPS